MDKIKYIPLALFCLAVLKAVVIGATLSEVAFIAVLGAVAGFYEYKNSEKRLKILEARFDAVDTHLTTLYKENVELKSYVSVKKLGDMRYQSPKI